MNSCCRVLKIAPLFGSAVTCVGTCLLNVAVFISVMIVSEQVLPPSLLFVPCQRQQMTISVSAVFTRYCHLMTSAALLPNQNSASHYLITGIWRSEFRQAAWFDDSALVTSLLNKIMMWLCWLRQWILLPQSIKTWKCKHWSYLRAVFSKLAPSRVRGHDGLWTSFEKLILKDVFWQMELFSRFVRRFVYCSWQSKRSYWYKLFRIF